MYKLIYFSKKANKIKVIMFALFNDCADYFYKNYDDIDFDNHFAKILKE